MSFPKYPEYKDSGVSGSGMCRAIGAFSVLNRS